MKSAYVKPSMTFEDFRANEYIAACTRLEEDATEKLFGCIAKEGDIYTGSTCKWYSTYTGTTSCTTVHEEQSSSLLGFNILDVSAHLHTVGKNCETEETPLETNGYYLYRNGAHHYGTITTITVKVPTASY